MTENSSPSFICAAGGIVWRSPELEQIAVIYRDRYLDGECCLPKGKLDPSEDWEGAARREVLEETGCEAEIQAFSGILPYFVGHRPKVVAFFDMVVVREGPFRPSREVRKIAWVTPQDALAILSHESEREMLRTWLSRRHHVTRKGRQPEGWR